MKTYKDRIAERKRVRQRRRAPVERGAVDVPEEEPGNKNDEQVAVRHADTSVRVNKRRSGQQAKNTRTNGGTLNDCISIFRSVCCSGISCEG